MKLVSFHAIAKMNKMPNLDSHVDSLLVMVCPEDAHPRVVSNYNVLQRKYALEEVVFESKKYLISNSANDQLPKIKEDLQTIEDLDILDDEDYLKTSKEFKQQKALKYLGHCSFCGKKLTAESSLVGSMGPVCEHKSHKLETSETSLEIYSDFKPLGAMNLKKGDSLILKTDKFVGFYEFLSQEKGELNLINRKTLAEQVLVKRPLEALIDATEKIPVSSVVGVCSPSNTEAKSSAGLWDDISSLFGKDSE